MSAVKTAPAFAWPTLAVADLLAHPGNALPEADADLTADVAEHGITDPLHVAATSSGAPQVLDGLRRLAAAAACGMDAVPVTRRPVVRVADLTPHPDNPREDLDLNAAFVATIREEGCRTAVVFRVLPDGTRQIVDGHRRYYAAQDAGLTHLPYQVEDRDDAGVYVDMLITATHRSGLSAREESAALFSAAEAGAGVKRLAVAAGTTQKDVRARLKVRRSKAVQTAEQGGAEPLSMETALELAQLEARDPAAAEKAAAAVAADPRDGRWLVRRAAADLDRREESARHRAELEKRGARILGVHELGAKAAPLHYVKGDTTAHETECQGHVWVLEGDRRRFTPYCANTSFYGHEVLNPDGSAKAKRRTAAETRAIRAGNLDWDAAEGQRREWLCALITRAKLPRALSDQMAQVAAMALHLPSGMSMASRIGGERALGVLPVLLGMPDTTRLNDAQKAAANRWTTPDAAARPLFLAVAAAYEGYITRHAWRTGDGAHADVRAAAAQWLTWLTTLGYQPAPVEAATRDGLDYRSPEAEPQRARL